MKILIKVTKEILAKSAMCGKDGLVFNKPAQYTRKNCAIALAVREIASNAQVSNDTIDWKGEVFDQMEVMYTKSIDWMERAAIIDNVVRKTIKLPIEAKKFIKQFDNSSYDQRKKMQPIEFEVEFPESLIQEIGIKDVYKVLSESKTLELVQ